MLSFPNCKINIGLFVTRKREDGYHDLETIFYPVMFRDVLEITPSGKTAFHPTGLPVTGDEKDNLVLKAYHALAQKYPGKIGPVDIHLHKIIPMGAGLGGGSADASFMLKILDSFFGLGLPKTELAAIALQLGSDCPFFIYNEPVLAKGRGEIMAPIEIDLSTYSIQLICPEVHVSTREAFSNINPQPAPFNLSLLHKIDVKGWKHHVANDFEKTVLALRPELASIKYALYEQGAVYASLSGSGSAIYGIFNKGKKATLETNTKFTEFYME